MSDPQFRLATRLGQSSRSALGRIEVLALFPMLVLFADWAGIEDLALLTALILSGLLALGVLFPQAAKGEGRGRGSATITGKSALLERIAQVFAKDGEDTVCLLIKVMDWTGIVDTWGHDAAQGVSARLQDRLQTALRGEDLLCKLGDARFGIVLSGMPSARLGLRDGLAARLAKAAQEPMPLNGTTLQLDVAIGHSSIRRRAANPDEATFKAAEAALAEASTSGKGEIRAYADGMGRARNVTSALSAEIEDAIHSAAIDTWFQPQICARTGGLTGFETLARWQHPVHGLLAPSEFLPAVTASGRMALFGETMLHRAIKALAGFDNADADVPNVSVNLSRTELQDPTMLEKVRFELQRYDLSADRLAFEISADVMGSQDDETVAACLAALQADGHRLIIDRAGPTAVPLLALQRFSIDLIKIDRALILGIDADPRRAQAVSAIVAMASAMQMDTLAHGVETQQEMEALTQIGCTHFQGYGIARPMPRDKVVGWVRAQRASKQPILLKEKRAG